VLDVKINSYPTHAASLPVAIIPNCAATRTSTSRSTAADRRKLTPPSLDDWPELDYDPTAGARRVDLDGSPRGDRDLAARRPLLLSGKLLTGRDAAHKRIDLLDRGEPCRRAST
jgi:fumarate hydratase class I